MTVDLITWVPTKWLSNGICRTKGWSKSKAGQSERAGDFITLLRMVCNWKHELLILGIFHFIFSDCGWPWITETTESETVDKGGTTVIPQQTSLSQHLPHCTIITYYFFFSLNHEHQEGRACILLFSVFPVPSRVAHFCWSKHELGKLRWKREWYSRWEKKWRRKEVKGRREKIQVGKTEKWKEQSISPSFETSLSSLSDWGIYGDS